MNKNNLILIILSCIVVVVYIGYTVYDNIFTVNYIKEENVGEYIKPIDTNMYLDTLNQVNSLGLNIKITNQQLAGGI